MNPRNIRLYRFKDRSNIKFKCAAIYSKHLLFQVNKFVRKNTYTNVYERTGTLFRILKNNNAFRIIMLALCIMGIRNNLRACTRSYLFMFKEQPEL